MMVDVARLSLEVSTNGVQRARQALQGLQDGSIRATRASQNLTRSIVTANRSGFRPMKGAVQQAGFQIGDFATQVGSGQSALIAFSQQASQMAQIFGPGGAVIGAVLAIGGAIAGGLVRSFGEGEVATEDLAEKMRELAKEMGEVSERQRDIINTGYAATIAEQNRKIEEQRARIFEANRVAETFFNNQRRAGVPAAVIEQSEAWQNLIAPVEDARNKIELYKKTAKNTEREQEEFWESIDNGGETTEDTAAQLQKLIESTQAQADTIGLSARETAIYEATRLGATAADLAAINAAFDVIDAEKQRQEELKRTRQQTIETAKENAQFAKSWQALQDRLDPTGADLRELGNDIAVIQEAFSRGLITQEQADMMVNRLNMIGEAADPTWMQQYLESARVTFTDFQRLTGTVADNFSSSFGNAFESVIFDFQSVGDAGREMLLSLLRSTVNALGQMAAQWLAYQAVQAAFGASTASASAAALTAEAAAQQQLAALNAFASTAAIPVVGPAAAPGAAAAALGATAPFVASVASLSASMAASQAASFDGGGFTGYGSRTGGMDGKGGFPAILHPNETVVDHTRGQGMGGDVVVNVNNAPPGTTTSERTDARGNRFVDVFVADMSNGGPMSKAIQTTYGVRRQGR